MHGSAWSVAVYRFGLGLNFAKAASQTSIGLLGRPYRCKLATDPVVLNLVMWCATVLGLFFFFYGVLSVKFIRSPVLCNDGAFCKPLLISIESNIEKRFGFTTNNHSSVHFSRNANDL